MDITYPFYNWSEVGDFESDYCTSLSSSGDGYTKNSTYFPANEWTDRGHGLTCYGTATITSGDVVSIPAGYAFVCDYTTQGTFRATNGSGIVVNANAYCNIRSKKITFEGSKYGIEVKSGGYCRLFHGHFKGNTRAIQAADYSKLLVEGSKFVDVNGAEVPYNQVANYKEIYVVGKGIKDNDGGWWDYNEDTGMLTPLDGQTAIPEHGFEYSEYLPAFHKLTFAPQVTAIGDYAFTWGIQIREVTFPDTLTTIGQNPFGACYSLSKVKISANTVNLGPEIFYNCALYTAGPIGSGCDIEFGWTESLPENAFYGCNNLTSITLPKTITEISDLAFAVCQALPSFDIPDHITSIGQCAFAYCTSLASVKIPSSVTSILYMAFQNCTELTTVTVPGSVKYIDECVFYKCTALKTIILEDGVETLDHNTFGDCEVLNNVTIPRTVNSLGKNVFINCTALKKVTYGGSPSMWTSIQNSESPSSVPTGCQIVYGMKDIKGKKYTWGYDETTGLLMPPSGVTEIPDNEFFSNLFTYSKLVICEGIMSIGSKAFFYSTNLANVTIPRGITEIKGSVFQACDHLSNISIPDTVTDIGTNAFSDCPSLTNITIPSSVTSIKDLVFARTGLISINIPEGTTNLGSNIFSGCTSITKVTIPKSVVKMKDTFRGCDRFLTAGPIGYNCNIEFGWDTEIPDGVFANTASLINIIFPNTLIKIGTSVFSNCTGLTKITIPSSVTSIGNNAFACCSELIEINIPKAMTRIHDFLPDCTKLTTAGPTGSGCNIEFEWDDKIPNAAFAGFTSLTKITIPSSVTSIGNNAFGSCSELVEINIPKSVSIISTDIFKGCTKLLTAGPTGGGYNIEFEWDTYIPNLAFYGCSTLNSITIPEGIIKIGSQVFEGCILLKTVGAADSNADIKLEMTKIPAHLFEYTTTITTLNISDSITEIGDYAFKGCTNLEKVIIPTSFNKFGDGVFKGCTKLLSAGFTNSGCNIEFGWTEEIPDNAFNGADKLTKLTIPATIKKIGNKAFYDCVNLDYAGGDTDPNAKIVIKGDIPENAFNGSNYLANVLVPPDKAIGKNAFANCPKLKSALFCHYEDNESSFGPDGSPTGKDIYNIFFSNISNIKENSLYGANCITKVKYYRPTPINISIGAHAFAYCTNLSEIENVLNTYIDNIGEGAFEQCTSLSNIDLSQIKPPIPEIIPPSDEENDFIEDTEIPLKAESPISLLSNNPITIIIPKDFCKGCTKLNTITFGNNSFEIGESAFEGCTSLRSTIGSDTHILTIGNRAFYNTGLTDVTLSSGLQSIGVHAFAGCQNLYHIIIPNTVNSMLSSIFQDCAQLTTLGPIGLGYDIEFDGWTEVPANAFIGANRLIEVWLDDNIIDIQAKAFYGCTNLKTVHLGNNVKNIYNMGFSDCTNLQNINIPASIKYISTKTFKGCNNLTLNYELSEYEWMKLFSLDRYTLEDYYPATAVVIFGKSSAGSQINEYTQKLLEAQKPYNSSKYGAEDPHYNPDKEWNITTKEVNHGTLTANPVNNKLNSEFNISLQVDKGYELDKLNLNYKDGVQGSITEILTRQDIFPGRPVYVLGYDIRSRMYPDDLVVDAKLHRIYDWSNITEEDIDASSKMIRNIPFKIRTSTSNVIEKNKLSSFNWALNNPTEYAWKVLVPSKYVNISIEEDGTNDPSIVLTANNVPDNALPETISILFVNTDNKDYIGIYTYYIYYYNEKNSNPFDNPEDYSNSSDIEDYVYIDTETPGASGTVNMNDMIGFSKTPIYIFDKSLDINSLTYGDPAIDFGKNRVYYRISLDRDTGEFTISCDKGIPWGAAQFNIPIKVYNLENKTYMNYTITVIPRNVKKAAFDLSKEITLYTGTEGTWECNLSDIEGFPTNILGDPTFSSGFFMVPMHTDMSMKVVDKKKLQLTYNIQQDAVEFSGTSKVDFPWTISNMDNYEDSKINVRVNMVTKKITNATITKQPTLAYDIGDPIDLTGMEMMLTYNDGSQETKTYDSTWDCQPKNGTQFTEDSINGYIFVVVGYGEDNGLPYAIAANTEKLTVKEYMCMSTDMNPYGGESTIPKALYRKGEIVPITVKVPSGYYVDMTKLHNQGSTSSDKVITTMGYTERVEITPKNVDEYGNGTYEMIMPPCSTMINIIYTNTPPAKTYTVTLGFDDWEGGNRISVSGGGTFQEGEECSASADVRGTYFFDGWYTDPQCTPANRVSTANPYKFKVTQDITLYATYNG